MLSAQDVVILMKAAKDVGIRELRFGELQFVFDDVIRFGSEANPKDTERILAQNEYDLRSEQLETLKLVDPVAYERLITEDKEVI